MDHSMYDKRQYPVVEVRQGCGEWVCNYEQGRDFSKAAAIGKLLATEVAEKTARNAIQIHGSYGYSREFPVERIYRDQCLITIGEGTSEIQRAVIARKVLQKFGG